MERNYRLFDGKESDISKPAIRTFIEPWNFSPTMMESSPSN